jgi:MoxR-like ATPase
MDRFMFKLIVTYPNLEELGRIVGITQVTMDETANKVCSAEDLLLMRKIAKEILVAEDVIDYTMRLTLATHPTSEVATHASKKYVRFGASPRAAQALITASKVRALMDGRYNVSYQDINALAKLVLRHRIRPNFEAITEGITTDHIIELVMKELGKSTESELTQVSKDMKENVVLEAQEKKPETTKGLFGKQRK